MTDFSSPTAVAAPLTDATRAAQFYVVSLRKFAILFFMTLGGYQLYWFYKNWRCFKDGKPSASESGPSIWPVPRALFSIFFVHSLFRVVKQHAPDNARVAAWENGNHATLVVVLIILSNGLSRLSNRSGDAFWPDLLSLLILLPLGYAMGAAQEKINLACGDPEGATNAALTTANYVWIVLGAIAWVAILMGIFSVGTPATGELGW
ncbi:hypothetical protein [Massilia sp. S19_KUP03_FR1]|uniref:hypothetical protein n=1 Tax=Massilia sp. S19_KUP03_FR1 TaxID=3025503 RepID=UPI002FCDA40E